MEKYIIIRILQAMIFSKIAVTFEMVIQENLFRIYTTSANSNRISRNYSIRIR